MTVVVAVKISDGIVAASDSASSLMVNGNQVLNIYNNANKIFNLCKGLPLGAMTCGAGSVGKLSVSAIAKDFRALLAEDFDASGKLTVKEVADRYFDYLKTDHYDKAHPAGGPNNPVLRSWVFGFSPGENFPEIYQFSLGDTAAAPSEAIAKDQGGLAWGGEPEVVQRIVLGSGTQLRKRLTDLGLDGAVIDQALAAEGKSQGILSDAMPIQDAIDLAQFLVSATIEFSRFKMGAATVGGPVEVAAITKHEGFKWIKRKHYFSLAMNPHDGGQHDH